MPPKDNNKPILLKKINPLYPTIFLLAVMTILSTGCGGGSGNNNNDSDDNTNNQKAKFRIKLLNNSNSNQPVADIYVSLHNTDNKTIAKTILTDNNGIADFGNIASAFPGAISGNPSRITVTTAYQDPLSERVEIQTSFNILVKNYTFYIQPAGCNERGKVNVEFNAIGENDTRGGAILNPLGSNRMDSFNMTSDTTLFNNVTVCQRNIQHDGKLSFLAGIYDSTNKLTNYGYLLDQTFTDGASYTGTADLTPITLNWTAAEALHNIVIGATRTGVTYPILGQWNTATAADTGAILAADQFPVDSYTIFAGKRDASENTTRGSQRRYQALSPNPAIELTDLRFTHIDYDAASESFDWALTGNTAKDYLEINATFDANNVAWSLSFPSNFNTLTLPELPSEVQTWFNRDKLIRSNTNITANNMVGFDNAYDTYMSALGSVDATINMLFDGVDFSRRTLKGVITFSGDAASTLPSTTFTATNKTNNGLQGATWKDTNDTVILVIPNPLDFSKAKLVSVTTEDNSWQAEGENISNVKLNGPFIIFNEAILTNTDAADLVLTGSLGY